MAPKSWTVILAVLIIGIAWTTASPLNNDLKAGLDAWDTFVQTYQKSYATDEEYQIRKDQFLKNYESFSSRNKKFSSSEASYQEGVNEFSDLSSEEFVNAYTGIIIPQEAQPNSDGTSHPNVEPLVGAPLNYDWRSVSNVLTAIKNQGQCGSCWAFATTATLEGAYNKKVRSLSANISEQHVLDCNSARYGCNGGWPTSAFDYIRANGTATLASYPYRAVQGTCQSRLTTRAFSAFTRYYVNDVSDATLQNLLYTYGPLTVLIDATPLQSYTSGILNTRACSSINHAVNLVGYVTSGTGAPYYILRNSWGTSWGERGYFRLAAANSCFIKQYVWYAVY